MFNKIKNSRFTLPLIIAILVLAVVGVCVAIGLTDAYFTDNDKGGVQSQVGTIGVGFDSIDTAFYETVEAVEDIYWGTYTPFSFNVENKGNMAIDTTTNITITSTNEELDWNAFSEAFTAYDMADVTGADGIYQVNEDAVPYEEEVLENGLVIKVPVSALSADTLLGGQKVWQNAEGKRITKKAYNELNADEKTQYVECGYVKEHNMLFYFNDMDAGADLIFTVDTVATKVGNSVGWNDTDQFVRYGRIAYNPYRNMLAIGPELNVKLQTLIDSDTTRPNSAAPLARATTDEFSMYNIEFTNKPVDTQYAAIDVSYAQDGSVMAWLDTTRNTYWTYAGSSEYYSTIYITAKDGGMIRSSEDMSYAFNDLHFEQWNSSYSRIDEIHNFGFIFDNIDMTNALDMSYMFRNVVFTNNDKYTPDFTDLTTVNVEDMSHMFEGANITAAVADLLFGENWTTEKVVDMSYMFYNAEGYMSGEWSNDSLETMAYMFAIDEAEMTTTNRLDIHENFNTSNVIDMSHAFKNRYFNKITLENIQAWDTINVEDMSYMFYHASSGDASNTYNTLDLTNWDTSNVGDMSHMFEGFNSDYKGNEYYITKFNLSGWSTSRVEDMSYMFADLAWYTGSIATSAYYGGITNIDITDWDVSSCRNMSHMFANDCKLTAIDMTDWNTSNVEDMSYMFYNINASTDANSITPIGPSVLDVSGFDTSNVKNMEYMFYGCFRLTTLDVSGFNTENVENMSYMFGGCGRTAVYKSYGIKTLDVSNFNTANVTNMAGMFDNCQFVTTIDVSGFDTTKVEDMSYMFNNCKTIKVLNVSGFDTANVTDMSYMFNGVAVVTAIDVSNFETNLVENMSHMFAECKKITTLDLTGFNTENVTDMNSMFYYCNAITSVSGAHFDTANVTDMGRMFAYSTVSRYMDLSTFNTSKVEDMSGMFYNSSIGYNESIRDWDVSKITDFSSMFYNCSFPNSKSLDLSRWDVSNAENIYEMFNTSGLTELDLSGWQFTKTLTDNRSVFNSAIVTILAGDWTPYMSGSTSSMFVNVSYLIGDTDIRNRGSNKSYLDTLASPEGLFNAKPAQSLGNVLIPGIRFNELIPATATSVVFTNTVDTTATLTDLSAYRDGSVYGWLSGTTYYVGSVNGGKIVASNCREMFFGKSKLTTIDLTNLDTSHVTNMVNMFQNCSKLVNIDASLIDTSNVVSMWNMFYGCKVLTTIDMSTWNTSKLQDTYCMFLSCAKLKNVVGIEKWDMSALRDVGAMFNSCASLVAIEHINDWDTSNITNMQNMFYSCTSFQTLDLSNWNVSNVTNLYGMFHSCTSLVELDLTNWNVSSVTSARFMFEKCSKLVRIYAGDWTNITTPSQHDGMFTGCGSSTGSATNWTMANTVTGYFIDKYALESNVLLRGNEFAYKIPSTTTAIVFDNELSVPNGVTLYDFSEPQDGSIMGWLEGTTLYITTVDGSPMYLNKDCRYMFYPRVASNIATIDFGNINTSKMTYARYMFHNCKVTELDLSGWNTSNLVEADSMFNSCYQLTILDMTGWDISNVTSAGAMFTSTNSLSTIYASDWSTENAKLSQSLNMFSSNSYLPLSGAVPYDGYLYTFAMANTTTGYFTIKPEHETNMMIDGPAFNRILPSTTKNVVFTNAVDESYTLTDLSALQDGSVMGWYNSSTYTYHVAATDGGRVIAHHNCADMFKEKTSLQTVDFTHLDTSRATTFARMFYGCTKFTGFTGTLDTTNVINMFMTFRNCTAVTKLDLTDWDVSNVQSLCYMFDGCSNLQVLDMTGWDVSSVKMAPYMFQSCKKLARIYANDWTDMVTPSSQLGGTNMFSSCAAATGTVYTWAMANTVDGYFLDKSIIDSNIAISGKAFLYSLPTNAQHVVFNTQLDIPSDVTVSDVSTAYDGSVVAWLDDATKTYYITTADNGPMYLDSDCSNMFDYGTVKHSLITVDFGDLERSVVTNMNRMFYKSSYITTIKGLDAFETVNVTNMAEMFHSCSKLTELDLSSWNVSSVQDASAMFYGCSTLTTIYAGDWTNTITPSKHTNMFYNCSKLVGAISYSSSKVNWTYANPTTGYFVEIVGDSNVIASDISFANSIPADATSVVFDRGLSKPAGVSVIDFSAEKDKSIIGWLDGTTLYVTSANCSSGYFTYSY